MKISKISLLLIALFITGCGNPTTSNETTVTSEEVTTSLITQEAIKSDVFISEVYGSSTPFANAVEIGTTLDSINLNDYSLNIYNGKNVVYTYKFNNITISSSKCYVIGNAINDNNDYHKWCDTLLDENILNGSNYLELIDNNNRLVDVFGSKMKYKYAIGHSCVRLEENFHGSNEFDLLGFISVRSSKDYKYLGNLKAPITKAELLKGPKITDHLANLDFEVNRKPGGGFARAKVVSYGDGDTTYFQFNQKFEEVSSIESVRYMFINTPEIDHGDGGEEPWGMAAKRYNNEALRKAKSILVQSPLGYGFREVYGRLLGFVWISEVENPELSDYVLLNHDLVVNGYARFGDGDELPELYSNDITYYSYFDYANLYASINGLKVYGEKDPNFNY